MLFTSSQSQVVSIALHHCSQVVNFGVTMATLMEPQGPVWGQVGLANHLVLLNHCLWTGTQEEVKIKDTWEEWRENGREGEDYKENIAEQYRTY